MSRGWVILYGVLVGVALVTAIVGGYLRYEPSRDAVTRIVASPCQQDPEGRECARLRKQIVGVEPLSVPCTSLRRIVRDKEILARFTVCLDPRQDLEQNGSTNESGGNDATDPSDGPAPGPGPSDPSGGDSGGDPGDGGGGVADDPPATDPPPAGGGGGENPRPPGGGGDPPGGPSAPPTADPSPPTLGSGVGEVIDSITGGVCEQTGLSLPAVCP